MTDREEQKWSAPEQPGEPNPDEAAVNAFVKYGIKAVDEHIKFQDGYLVPGFLGFACDVDVYVGLYRFTLPNGVYLLKEGEDLNQALVYLLSFDKEEIAHLSDGKEYEEVVDENGNITRTILEPVNFTAQVMPIETGDGRFLTYLEYVAWLAMNVAGSDEERDEIFNAAYRVTGETEIVKDSDKPAKHDGRKPTRRYDPVTKLHQTLTDPRLYGELGITLDVAGRVEKKKGRRVENIVSLEYVSDDDNVDLTRQLSEFDIQVYNGIASLYEAGKRAISAQDIYEMTIGRGKAKQPQIDKIIDSVEVLRRTKLRADVSAEAKAHGLVDPDTGAPWEHTEIDDFLFSAVRVKTQGANNKQMAGYQFNSMPIGLKYAKASKQIVSYPVKYLDTKSAGSNTERNVVIRGYLLQRIAQAKGGKMPNIIKCETIYNKAGVNGESRVERNRVNNYVIKLLELWQEQGMISGFNVIREERQRMTKVEVFF